MAYGECSIDGSPMDYESNGAGKALNDNGLLSSTMLYRGLFEPESAAALLLNLSDDSSEVKMERLYEESGSVNLEITFLEDEEGLPVRITMVQPYGDIGIWIPKDYRIDPLARFMKMDWNEVRSRDLHVDRDGLDRVDGIVCIAEIPEADIRIYGYGDAECSGQGGAVEIGDDVNYFDWFYTSSHAIFPACYWNGADGQLQVALHIYTGTGVSAQELHVLQRYDTGTLSDHVLDLNDYEDMLQERIDHSIDEETGLLTLYDTRNQKELACGQIGEDRVESLELGSISHFLLGDTIRLVLEPGYFPEGSPIAEYPEEMSALEAELILLESQGEIRFELGEIRAAGNR